MPGTVYRAVPKTTLPLNTLTSPPVGTFVLSRSIDVSQYRELTALVRIHSCDSLGYSDTFVVDILAEALTAQDMVNDFVSTQVVATTTIAISSGFYGPSMNAITPVSVPMGSAVRVRVTTTGDSQTTSSYVTFSVDIVVKS